MSFLAEVMPQDCWIILYSLYVPYFFSTVNKGGLELPCMTGVTIITIITIINTIIIIIIIIIVAITVIIIIIIIINNFFCQT